MRVGILFENGSICNVDYSLINKGNPGIGGTEYLVVQLAYYLQIRENEIEIILLVSHPINNAELNNQIIIENKEHLFSVLKSAEIDLLIFIPHSKDRKFYMQLDKWGKKSIAWVHNYLSYGELNLLCKSNSVSKVVFVSREHFECYYDDDIFIKSTFIYNMIPTPDNCKVEHTNKHFIVTYVGALIRTKGFHKLAKQWKKIVRIVPNAQLYIIGSGKLYKHDSVLGKYGLASDDYERQFMKYLVDTDRAILKSVHFMGTMGNEKDELMCKTKVGVVNPTGKSETFCLGAVEFESYGVPVVAYKGFGFLDTVVNKKTGILCHRGYTLRKAIIQLLTNDKIGSCMAHEAKRYYLKNFTPEIILKEWEDLLNNKMNMPKFKGKNLWNDYKWLKVVNRITMDTSHMKWMSVSRLISKIKFVVKKYGNANKNIKSQELTENSPLI